jgi:type III secretory pathway component EscT
VPAPLDLGAALPTWLVALGLGAARAIPIAWLVPAFGGRSLPVPARLGMGILLASLGWPHLVPAAAAPQLAQLNLVGWGWLTARELLVGASVGWVVALAFRAAAAAGGLADGARGGAGLADAASPLSGEAGSPLGELYWLSAALIFVEIGGLGRLAGALARSYQAIPIGTLPPAPGASSGGVGMGAAVELIVIASARLVESAVGLASPVIVALLLADLALAAVARLTPGVPIHFAAMPLRALLGVGVVLLGLGALHAALGAGVPGWLALAERGFLLFR